MDIKELLTKYTQYLYDCNYLDDDWWCEEPCSVDRFIEEELENVRYNVLADGWRETSKILPESGQCVLIYSEKSGVAEGAYLSAKGHFEQWRWNCVVKDVTHWQPLPPPPTVS